MKLRFVLTIILLVEFSPIRGYLLEESELLPASEFGEREVKRDKRTLTTICVEIKPNSPHEEPYFMCRGTDAAQPSKISSYGGSGPQSSKPSYKPNPSASYGESESYQSGYNRPVKTNYPQPDHSKYGTPISYEPQPSAGYGKQPSYSNPTSSGGYSSYENAKPSYGVKQYESHDYSKPNVHLSIHGTSSNPHDYKPSGYSSSDSAGYSKPSSYGPTSAYTSLPAHGGSSYSTAPQGAAQSSSYDGKYPSLNSYSSKPSSYEHADHLGYSLPKSPYSSQPGPKAYSKSTYNPSPTYTKPTTSDYIQPSSKPVYPSNPQSYRGTSDDLMPSVWNSHQQDDNFQFRPVEYYINTQRSMEQQQYQPADTESYEPSGPQLQAASPLPATGYDAYPQPVQYAPAIPSYQPAVPSAVLAPSPTYTPYIPVPYSSAPISYAPPLRIQAYQPPIHLLKPSCPQSYLYSLQPTIISLPCLSSDPAGSNLGVPHQFYQANINPLHDVPGGRSTVPEADKSTENNSSSVESVEVNKKLDTEKESTPKKPEAKATNEKQADKKDDATAAKEKSKDDPPSTSGDALNQPEDGNTKVAYEAMIKMAKLAAQLKKDPEDE